MKYFIIAVHWALITSISIYAFLINAKLSRFEQEMELHIALAVAERAVLAEIVNIGLSDRINEANEAIQAYLNEGVFLTDSQGEALTKQEKEKRAELIGLQKEQFEILLKISNGLVKRGKLLADTIE